MVKIKSAGSYRLEACVVSLSQALQAQKLGADRIEICSHLETNGMTPDVRIVEELCRHLSIPIRVMIRSTPVGYEASDEILDGMVRSINEFKILPIDGFVIGVLKNKKVDREAMEVILRHAYPLPVTFHKAIDESVSLDADLKWMNAAAGIDTVLTSGGSVTAFDGIDQLLLMKSIFKRTIMAGGKIKPQQVESLHQKIGLDWYHGRSIVGDLGN